MADQAIYAPFVVLDGNGNPVSGALAYFYASGTTSMISVYEDEDGTIASDNPVEANANGVLPQRFFSGNAAVVITTPEGVTLTTLDPVPKSISSTAAASQVTFSPTSSVPAANVQDAIDTVQANLQDLDDRAQPLDGALTTLAALSLVEGDTLYATASETLARLPKGTARQVLQMNAGATAPEWGAKGWTYIAAQATTTATEFDFTGIPDWATDVEFILDSVTLSSYDKLLVQVGGESGLVTTGYVANSTWYYSNAVRQTTNTTAFPLYGFDYDSPAFGCSIPFRLISLGSNTWMANAVGHNTSAGGFSAGGKIVMSEALTRLRLSRSASATFDSGSALVRYR